MKDLNILNPFTLYVLLFSCHLFHLYALVWLSPLPPKQILGQKLELRAYLEMDPRRKVIKWGREESKKICITDQVTQFGDLNVFGAVLVVHEWSFHHLLLFQHLLVRFQPFITFSISRSVVFVNNTCIWLFFFLLIPVFGWKFGWWPEEFCQRTFSLIKLLCSNLFLPPMLGLCVNLVLYVFPLYFHSFGSDIMWRSGLRYLPPERICFSSDKQWE